MGTTIHFKRDEFPLIQIKATLWQRLRISFYVMLGILNLKGMTVSIGPLNLTPHDPDEKAI